VAGNSVIACDRAQRHVTRHVEACRRRAGRDHERRRGERESLCIANRPVRSALIDFQRDAAVVHANAWMIEQGAA
jgi:hypothetical protein